MALALNNPPFNKETKSNQTKWYGIYTSRSRKGYNKNIIKLATVVEGEPMASLFNIYYTELSERRLLLFQDCHTLTLIHTL